MTRAEERDYVISLAEAADELRVAGNRTPNAEDIARQHFGGLHFGAATTADVRKKLLHVRDILADPSYGFEREVVRSATGTTTTSAAREGRLAVWLRLGCAWHTVAAGSLRVSISRPMSAPT